MCSDTSTLLSLFRLAWISDSALPVGSFSFSMGLEGAIEGGIVRDAATLEEYVVGLLHNATECDCIALTEGFRAARDGDHSRLVEADHRLLSFKTSHEARNMTTKMGARLAGLVRSICPTPLTREFHRWGTEGITPTTYPVAQAVAGMALGVDERALYAAHLYGVANTALSAAMRLMRLSHYTSQEILYRLSPLCEEFYDRYGTLSLEDMCSFAPTLELSTSLHERGKGRLFMN